MSRLRRPEGTVTLLFTDVEGSTRLWQTEPEAMLIDLQLHDQLLRREIERFDGFVFKTVGDQFCAAFSSPAQAVRAAVCSLLALTQAAWTSSNGLAVRFAVHTGPVEVRDGDYFGSSLSKVARLVGIGHARQIIASSSTQELLSDEPMPGFTLVPLGPHHLRDFTAPIDVFQVVAEGLPSSFPPLRSRESGRSRPRLPVHLTKFVGRESVLREVCDLLAGTRVLTLTGAGGSGKTRLALECAVAVADALPDGACFVDLGPITDESLLPQQLASALELKESPGQPLIQSILDHLRPRACLVILDNCEHLIDACASLSRLLATECPGLTVLATSREALGFPGETTYRVPSMSVPLPTEQVSPDSLLKFEACALFVERATNADSSFDVTRANCASIAAICRRLDGIPLALELAAARTRSMSPQEIESRLDERFRLLSGSSRAAMPRQQTLRSLIDWSHDLLSQQERAVFWRTSVFNGGWTLEAAERVLSGMGVAESEVLDMMTSLADKSLLVAERSGEKTRLRLLETVRQYARDRLIDEGESRHWRDAHLIYYSELASQAARRLRGVGQRRWSDLLHDDLDNLRVAMDWALGSHPDVAVRMIGDLVQFWIARSLLGEGREWVARARAVGITEPVLLVPVLEGEMLLSFFIGEYADANRSAAECLEAATRGGDDWQVSMALFLTGLSAVHDGDLARAGDHAERGLATARALDEPWLAGRHLVLLALRAWMSGEHAEARRHFTETLTISRALEDDWHIGITLANLGTVTRLCGDLEDAATCHREGLDLCVRIDDRRGVGWHLLGLAGVHTDGGGPHLGARLLGGSEAVLASVGSKLPPPQEADRRRTLENLLRAIGEAGVEAGLEGGRALGWNLVGDLLGCPDESPDWVGARGSAGPTEPEPKS